MNKNVLKSSFKVAINSFQVSVKHEFPRHIIRKILKCQVPMKIRPLGVEFHADGLT